MRHLLGSCVREKLEEFARGAARVAVGRCRPFSVEMGAAFNVACLRPKRSNIFIAILVDHDPPSAAQYITAAAVAPSASELADGWAIVEEDGPPVVALGATETGRAGLLPRDAPPRQRWWRYRRG